MIPLEVEIAELSAREESQHGPESFRAFDEFKQALKEGGVRAAEPDAGSPSGWRGNAWVKKGILLGFRRGCRNGSGLEKPGWCIVYWRGGECVIGRLGKQNGHSGLGG